MNDVPNAVDDSLVTSEDQMGSLNVRMNDVDIDGDTLLVTTLSPAASHGTVACLGGGGCSYTPVADYSGPDSFQYTISDGHGGTDTATVNITVTPENTPPVADDDAISTLEDNAGATNVLVGDTDVDGDTLSVSTSAPTAAHGTVSCAAGGVCTYTPSANYNGPDSFDYTVSDGRGKSDTGTVTVTVLPGNDAPLAVDDSLSTPEETAGQVDVLPNDTDLEGDSLSVTGSTNGAHGTASCDATTCTYTPALNYTGADTFTYTVSDGNGGTDTGSVSVTVTGVNDAPVADDDALTTDKDTPGNVNVLVGDTDVDGDTLSVATPSDPDHGAVSCNATTCTYTPDPGYLGADSFTYEVTDGQLADQGLVSVTVGSRTSRPVARAWFPRRRSSGPRRRVRPGRALRRNRCERRRAHVRDHGRDAGREDEAGQRPWRPIARRPARFRKAASDQASSGARSEGQRARVSDRLHGLRRPGRQVLERGEGRRAHQAGRDGQANSTQYNSFR